MFKWMKGKKSKVNYDNMSEFSYRKLKGTNNFVTLNDLGIAILSYGNLDESNLEMIEKMQRIFENLFNAQKTIKLTDNFYLRHEVINGKNLGKLSANVSSGEKIADATALIDDNLVEFFKITTNVVYHKIMIGVPVEVFEGIIFLWDETRKVFIISPNRNYSNRVLSYD